MTAISPHNVQQVSYTDMLENFRKRRNEWTKLYPAMDQLPALFPQLLTSKKCICVGAGMAQYDTEFIKRCMPKIEFVEVIEADPTCSDYLRKNLASMLSNERKEKSRDPPSDAFSQDELKNGALNGHVTSAINGINCDELESKEETNCEGKNFGKNANVNGQENGLETFYQLPKIEIYEGLVQDWSNTLDEKTYVKGDVLVAFHMFYYLDSEERKKFFVDCFHRWLKPGGLAFFVLISDNNCTNLMQNIHRELDLPVHLEIDEIKSEIRGLNFDVALEKDYSCVIDLSNLDSSSLELLQSLTCEFRSHQQILDAIDKVSQEGKGTYIAELIGVREKL